MKRYWLVRWLERWKDDGTVQAFKTAVHTETLAEAVRAAESELQIRSKANRTEYIITDAGMADEDSAVLVGKAETDVLGIDWPE